MRRHALASNGPTNPSDEVNLTKSLERTEAVHDVQVQQLATRECGSLRRTARRIVHRSRQWP